MAASAHRKFRRLLERKGYEFVEENEFGVTVYRLEGCREVRLFANTEGRHLQALTRQVEADTRHRDPEDTNEAREKQSAWELEEAERLQRVKADEELNRPRRLGGLSAVLSEREVDQVARRAERIMADRRQIDRLMRTRPLAT